jgi:hypothetical protein
MSRKVEFPQVMRVGWNSTIGPYKILIKRDKLENWIEHDPILFDGEICRNTTNGLIKIGDGTKKWSELFYVELVETDIK